MNDVKQFEGKSLEDAVSKACSYFGVQEEDLNVEIVDPGSSGIFGLGGRSAVVKASPVKGKSELEELVEQVVTRLISDIADKPELDIHVNEERINVVISDENSGLIIGKDGQNITALEYLANRIIAKRWSDKVYIQLDAGGYRQRQDDSIRQKALDLAQRVKHSGKTQSTKPMSSYHRRLVHLTLQEDDDITTRSKGDGPLKRVLIMLKRKKNQDLAQQG